MKHFSRRMTQYAARGRSGSVSSILVTIRCILWRQIAVQT
jgi:hypothetical protein